MGPVSRVWTQRAGKLRESSESEPAGSAGIVEWTGGPTRSGGDRRGRIAPRLNGPRRTFAFHSLRQPTASQPSRRRTRGETEPPNSATREQREPQQRLGPGPAVSGSEVEGGLPQDPAKAREFLGWSQLAGAESLQPRTRWRSRQAGANPSLGLNSLICRENTGNSPEYSDPGAARWSSSGSIPGPRRRFPYSVEQGMIDRGTRMCRTGVGKPTRGSADPRLDRLRRTSGWTPRGQPCSAFREERERAHPPASFESCHGPSPSKTPAESKRTMRTHKRDGLPVQRVRGRR
jgi:hypothetical protein